MNKGLVVLAVVVALVAAMVVANIGFGYQTTAYSVSVTRIAEQQLLAAEAAIDLLQIIGILLAVILVIGASCYSALGKRT